MAKIFWSSFGATGTFSTAFDPLSDVFVIDNRGTVSDEISASDITITESGGVKITDSFSGKTVTLTGVTLKQLTSSGTVAGNIRFNDESKLIVGDNTTGTANDDLTNTLNGSFGNDYLLGLGGNDTLNGNGGNDKLDGGTGNDVMNGGAGDDTYYVDSTADFASETSASTNDKVIADLVSGTSYTLGSGIEHLDLLGLTLNGTGNSLNNNITGNANDNILSGGAGNDTLIGNAGNDRLDGGTGDDTMTGGAGNDTYVVDSASDSVSEAPASGTDLVESSVTFSLASRINFENLSLTGTSAINGTGNSLDNILTGNAGSNILSGGDGNDTLIGNGGADTLDGGAGDDAMTGGAGNDTYAVDSTGDTVTEASAAGTDLVQATLTTAGTTYILADNVENLTLLGAAAVNGTGNGLVNILTGNGAANTLSGGGGADTLIGNGGNDTLDGGAGSDAMTGGAGNDTYAVDSTGDTVTEASGAGTDLVEATLTTAGTTYILAANVEDLTLLGSAAVNGTGNGLANILTGNGADNTLNGGGGADTLIGNGGNDTLDGGAGNDEMTGGAGNDTYAVDSTGDTVTEASGAGTDLIKATLTTAGTTYILADNVENLTLLGSVAVNGTGNGLNNTLTGNGSNNRLNGDTGIDTLIGGGGNDTYVVDGTDDVVTEALSAGTDLVEATLTTAGTTYTLADNVENLTLLGAAAVNGTGNGLVNTLTGNDAANTLNGGGGVDKLIGNGGADRLDGGAGIDTMIGGGGSDTYVVDSASDVVTEASGAGIDLVEATLTTAGTTYILAANVEKLTLLGSAAVNGTGNGLNNTLTGNDAANTLNGSTGSDTLDGAGGNDTLLGGTGNDTLDGGTGNDKLQGQGGSDTLTLGTVVGESDTVVFETTGLGNGSDTINNFTVGAGGDKLDFNNFFGAATTISTLVGPIDDSSTGEVDAAYGNVLLVNDIGGDLNTSSIADLFNTGTDTGRAFAEVGLGDKYVMITANAAGGDAKVWYLDTSLDGSGSDLSASDVQLVGTLVSVNNLGAFVADNFVA
jgi:Ca2+-binding RTX toxin-like protein